MLENKRPVSKRGSAVRFGSLTLQIYRLRLKDFHKFDTAATGIFYSFALNFDLMLTVAALEQTAALVEAKVTPRLTTLLDSLKDEKKSSLAVADPKLGTHDPLSIESNH